MLTFDNGAGEAGEAGKAGDVFSHTRPSGHICFFRTGVATPSKLPGDTPSS